MLRSCTRCARQFTSADFGRDDSRNMESERKAAGLVGVRFMYYHCPPCGADDIFVDILPRDGEFAGEYETRRAEMEAVVRALHSDRVAAVVNPVKKP